MITRFATPADMPKVAELSRQLASHVCDPDPGAGHRDLANWGFGPASWFECLVLEKNRDIIGFALFCKRFEAHTRRRYLWLGDLCVDKRHRQEGAGRKLVDALKHYAATLGCDGIDLELWKLNEEARRFYARVGATPIQDVDSFRILVTP
ncbi:GNAT family N-acetyltransferase [Ruegeria sp. MALMAid1280]|uniref:GNAT family N-acetyltransferase n=1 Tax=Ruegeria sp. MALMAid1280 TaxID=3411634 RepID=UPI003BA34923